MLQNTLDFTTPLESSSGPAFRQTPSDRSATRQATRVQIEAYLLPDGKVVDQSAACEIPSELIDLALGLIYEREPYAAFIWLGDTRSDFWQVSIALTDRQGVSVARLCATRLDRLPHDLSRRELEIITLIAAGGSNKEIASALTLSLRTVMTHCTNVMRKLNVSSRSGISAVAFGEGLLTLPFPEAAPWLQVLRVDRLARSRGRRTFITRTTGRSEKSIKIGALIPTRGRGAFDGQEMLNGAVLAVEEINARGGVYGKTLQLEQVGVDVDDRGSIRRAMDRLLRSGVDAVASGYLRHQFEAMEMASSAGVPFLHSSASSAIERVVASKPDRYQGVFQLCPTDVNYAPGFIRSMSELRDSGQWSPTSNVLAIASQHSWDFIDFGLEEGYRSAAAQGWELVVLDVAQNDRSERWVEGAVQAARLGPAAVMLGSFFVSDHEEFFTKLQAERSTALRYAIYAPSMPGFRRQLGQVSDGMLWATSSGTYSDRIGYEFASRYRDSFGNAPGRSHAGIAYDRVHILAGAWSQVEDPRDFSMVTKRLGETRYRGVNGSYIFDTPGNGTLAFEGNSSDPSLTQAHTVFQIQAGRNVLISPSTYAVGSFRRPAWASSTLAR